MIVGIEQASSARAAELGLKGACLGDMLSMGLEVPPGFIIPTSACVDFFEGGEKLAKGLFEEIKSGVESIEKKTGRAYGSGPRPLLLSVRSGAASPMPGMMETLLNLGMTPTTVEALAAETGDERFVLDCHRRFVRMFGQVVFGIDKREFHRALQQQLDRAGAFSPDDLDTHQFKKLTESYISVIHKTTRKSIPEDPYKQLQEAVEAVFHSWNSPRSMVFRNLMRIPHSSGTAVVVQAMVYGNIDSDSGVGTAITRDPIIGIKRLYGEYLPRAQGEEILEGGRTPRSISSIKEELPSVYEQLASVSEKLEQTYKNIQEIEFTIERGRLYFLQTRPATCTAQATIKAAVDMVSEGLLTREEALLLVNPDSLVQILHRYIDPNVQIRSLTRGLPASPGAASGVVAFSPEEAVNLKKQHRESILVRPDTKIEDMIGVDASDGLLLTRGGRSSHAAVVARRAGKPCVAGCTEIQIDTENNVFTIGEVKVKQGDVITIDGASGRVFLGTVPMRKTTISEEFRQLMSWADEVKTLGVRANSDTPEDALRAIELGAEGIGLCRTETMLMSSDRLPIIQTLVIADDAAEEKKLLTRLQKVHKDDFLEIFRYLNGKPAVLRLLDPPLHEFIPETEPLIRSICELRSKGANREVINLKESILKKIQTHREVNPM
ncbi:MAG TPA: pyruvate, phosphate dikinase, partial [bacterium]|nr:pyruvate, phosphate dikinase [bacterium]